MLVMVHDAGEGVGWASGGRRAGGRGEAFPEAVRQHSLKGLCSRCLFIRVLSFSNMEHTFPRNNEISGESNAAAGSLHICNVNREAKEAVANV